MSAISYPLPKNIQSYGKSNSVNFVFDKKTQPLYTKVQEHRFEQVLNNFLSNAAKFSGPNTDVEISAEARGSNIVVKVRDHGTGISEELKPKVFERFTQEDSTSSRKYAGTGLGPSIIQALTIAMGGTLTFESKAGVGQHFHRHFADVRMSYK